MGDATPIDQLLGGGNRSGKQDNTDLVQNILNDMHNQGGGQGQGQGGQGQGGQGPQQKQVHFEDNQDQDDDGDMSDLPYEQPLTFTEKIIRELRTPLLVMFLVFLTNYPFFTKMLQQNIPNILSYGGEFGLIGIKALFAGIIYYLVVRFAF